MTRTPPEPLDRRVTNLERNMADLRIAAEALLQTAQLHQVNFETIAGELQSSRARQENSDQLHQESNERFEILLAELRQLRIEADARQRENDERQRENNERFEILLAELRQLRIKADARQRENDERFEALLVELRQLRIENETRHNESDERFEALLVELRQLRIESEARLNGQQTEIRRLIDRLFNPENNDNQT